MERREELSREYEDRLDWLENAGRPSADPIPVALMGLALVLALAYAGTARE